MLHPRSIITNLRFTYKDQRRKLMGLTKYYQYRNDKSGATHVRQHDREGQRVERWIDCGLGNHYSQIVQHCLDRSTTDLKKNVGARLLVIGPEVHLMQAIPAERQMGLLKELTETTVENWFEKLHLPLPEYAYCIHESEPSTTRPDGRLKDEAERSGSYLHSHVVLAATVPGLDVERQSYKVYDKQITLLHEAARESLEHLWTRELGKERITELNQQLEARTQHYLELDQAYEQNPLTLDLPNTAVLPTTASSTPRRVAEDRTQNISTEMERSLDDEFGEAR
jgi:hypothetical protein